MDRIPRLALAAACLLPALALGADRPNVKTGLWEITHESANSGVTGGGGVPQMPAIPDEVLARMPPEARARIEAAKAGRAGGGKLVMRQCLTDRDLDHPFEHTDPRAGECKNQVVSRTASSAEVAIACRSGQVGAETHGTLKWQLNSPESMQGTIDTKTTLGTGQAIDHHAAISARWLGSDCGDVKPGSPTLVH